LTAAGVTDNVKIFATPLGKGELYLRVENVADLYDKNAKVEFVDLKRIVYHFWVANNAGLPFVGSDWEVTETSLTGNMAISELRGRKVQWKTEDDTDSSKSSLPSLDYKSGLGFSLQLGPQRLRAFKVTHIDRKRDRRSLADLLF